jgi:hypothetical protein
MAPLQPPFPPPLGEREERRKKKKKNQGLRGYLVLILVCAFFLKMLRCQLVSEGQKIIFFATTI